MCVCIIHTHNTHTHTHTFTHTIHTNTHTHTHTLAVVQGAQGIIERDRPEIYVEVGPEELTGDGGPVSAFLRGVSILKKTISLYQWIYLFIY
jgi:hypothetical protein